MFPEDLDAFFDTDGHAIAATLQGGATVNVIFDAPYEEVLEVAGVNPSALCKASAVAAGDVGTKTITISGTVYNIVGREPVDDGAIVRLQLQAAA